MKVIIGKQAKAAKREDRRPRVVLSLNFDGVDKFQGFSYSVEEGQRLARRSHTELPEFGGQRRGR